MRIKGKGKSILTRQRLPVLGLFEGLLDQVSGAAAAYSIRLLRADYSDGLLRVRAYDGSSDQGEADVLPDSNNEISLSSELTNRDSTAGSSGRDVSTLGELVTNSGGTDYDGFVSEWKDQSPNARHATNTTASEQPQIVTAGSLITENGKPAVKFNIISATALDISSNLNPVTDNFSIFNVARSNTNSGIFELEKGGFDKFIALRADRSAPNDIFLFHRYSGSGSIKAGGISFKGVVSGHVENNNQKIYKNGGVVAQSSDFLSTIDLSNADNRVLGNKESKDAPFDVLQEIIFYDKIKENKEGVIHGNQNSFFNYY